MRLLRAGGGSVRRGRGECGRRLPLQLWLRRLLWLLVRLRRGRLYLRLRHLLTRETFGNLHDGSVEFLFVAPNSWPTTRRPHRTGRGTAGFR